MLISCHPQNKTKSTIQPRIEPVEQVVHGYELVDPYQWMEAADNQNELNDWLLSEGRLTHEVLMQHPSREQLLSRATATEGNWSGVTGLRLYGERLFYFRRDVGASKLKLRMRDEAGADRLVLDMEAFSEASGKEQNLNGYAASPDGHFLAFLVSESGAEITTLKFLNIETGQLLDDEIPRIWGEMIPQWLPDNSGVIYSQMDPNLLIDDSLDPVQNMQLYIHQLGDDLSDDKHILGSQIDNGIIIERQEFPGIQYISKSGHVVAFAGGARSERRLFISTLDKLTTQNQPWQTIAEYSDLVTRVSIDRNNLYLISVKDKPNGEVLQLPLDNPILSKGRVIVPHSDQVVQSIAAAKDGLYIKSMHGGYHRLYRYDYLNQHLSSLNLPFDGRLDIATDYQQDGAYLRLISWTRKSEEFRYLPDTKEMLSIDFGIPADTEMVDYVAHSVEVPSDGGVMVPMTVIHHKDIQMDGTNPTILYGYGGYGSTIMPYYMISNVPWLEKGGVYAFVNVRGSGAKGRQWYLDGKGKNKQNGINDFNAAAEYLSEKGYADNNNLIAQGVSMGGILVSNAVIQRPELYAGAMINVAVINSTRFHKGFNGENQIPELGDPKNPDDFKHLLAIDAYQNLKSDKNYPSMMFSLGLNDNRVPPWHTGKFAAKLKASEAQTNPVFLRVSTKDGHGVGISLDSYIDLKVDGWIYALMSSGR